MSGWCSTPTLLLICSSFSRENCHSLLISFYTSTVLSPKVQYTNEKNISPSPENFWGFCWFWFLTTEKNTPSHPDPWLKKITHSWLRWFWRILFQEDALLFDKVSNIDRIGWSSQHESIFKAINLNSPILWDRKIKHKTFPIWSDFPSFFLLIFFLILQL